MSRRIVLCRSAAMLRNIGIVALSIASGGCAYFHPAFVTQESQIKATANAAGKGVLVCERRSLNRQSCKRVSRAEMSDIMADALARY